MCEYMYMHEEVGEGERGRGRKREGEKKNIAGIWKGERRVIKH